MPTFGHNLTSPELTALVHFLSTLHPENELAAKTANKALNPTE